MHCVPLFVLAMLVVDHGAIERLSKAELSAPIPQESERKTPPNESNTPEEDWSLHFQATVITQGHGLFHAPYTGTNSLLPESESDTSLTTTLFLGRRLWKGGALYFDPEVAGGEGLSGTLGIAGFPNGEITRVSNPEPTPYIARLYLEQTFDLGGTMQKIEPDANQLGGMQSDQRLTFRIGKMSATDQFDNNKYSNDPRTQFMNWGLVYNGAWDYPADTRGYTLGATAELALKDWAIRYGFFLMPQEANVMPLDYAVADNHGQVLEVEHSYSLFGRPGKARLMGYVNNANMGSYRETINTPAFGMDVTLSHERGRPKYGVGANFEQELSNDVGVFLRVGWNDGKTETFAFTEIDRTLAGGVSAKGTLWGRSADNVGFAFVVNGLAPDHKAYLERGGVGFIIGDGQLNYAPEIIFECYYQVKLTNNLFVAPDFQFVQNPAYNSDRGPVAIWAIRIHVEF